MRSIERNALSLLALFAVLALFAGGCGKAEERQRQAQSKTEPRAESKHAGWWCDEHGIPEEECSMCSPKLEKECKAKGDWCEKHNRALSQCFTCNPERQKFYAAKYRAKYGKEPPPVGE